MDRRSEKCNYRKKTEQLLQIVALLEFGCQASTANIPHSVILSSQSNPCSATQAAIAATQSSAMMPQPPGSRSKIRIGGGLVMSNSRNSSQPASQIAGPAGSTPRKTIGSAAISSKTMDWGSFVPPNARAAAEQTATLARPVSEHWRSKAAPPPKPVVSPKGLRPCLGPDSQVRRPARWQASRFCFVHEGPLCSPPEITSQKSRGRPSTTSRETDP